MTKYKIPKGFKKIKQFPNYFVNKRGIVISLSQHHNANRFCTKYIDRYGYERVWLYNKASGDCRKYVLVHRVVLQAFKPNPNKKKYNQINHKDGNKLNNNLSNLEWSFNSHNMLHKCRVLKSVNVGEKSSMAKLTEKQVRKIKITKSSGASIARKYNVTCSTIYRIKKGVCWGHLWPTQLQ